MKTKRNLIVIIHALIFLLFCNYSYSQKKVNGVIIEKIGGTKYYIHSVEKGNTLYSISKKYGVSIDEIVKNNPEVSNGLRIGQTLKIPVSKFDPELKEAAPATIQGNFLIHEVAEKETLYSIAKKYNIKVREIIDINPETATKDLSIGQKLKIPILKSQEIKPRDILPAVTDSLITHTAKKGETAFSIAKLYNVNVDTLLMLNPGIRKELKQDQVVRIPKLRQAFATAEAKDTISKSAIILKDVYNIALLLPLHVEINDSIERNLKFNEKPYIIKDSEVALLFYEGAMLALDSLRKTGVSVRANIFDTSNDSLEVAKLIQSSSLKNMDLIIGPFYQYLFKDVAAFAKQNQIGITCPVPQSAKILLENKYASKVLASPLVQSDQLAEFVVKKYPGKKILVFGSTEKTDSRLSQAFLQKAEEILEKQGKSLTTYINEYYFAEINTEKIKALLSLQDTNIIVIPSHNQVFTSDMLTKLNSLSGRFNFLVFGIDKLTEYDNIDVKYLHQLNVHVASPTSIDYENPGVKSFNSSFREKYKTDPGEFAFLGFDVTYYYVSALTKYGKNFYDYLPEFKMDMLTNNFDFIKTGYESGYENKHVFISKFQDFKLLPVHGK